MKNEWKENFWLLLEMIVVSVAVWVISLMLSATIYGRFSSCGFEYDDVYVGSLKYISKESPEFTPTPEDRKERFAFYADAVRGLMERFREKPYVEAVAIGSNAIPFNYNYYGVGWIDIAIKDSIPYYANKRTVTPDMALVLRYQSLQGKTPEELRDILAKGEGLISDNQMYENNNRNPYDLLGKEIGDPYSDESFKVGDIIRNVRRNEYEKRYDGTLIVPVDESMDSLMCSITTSIAIRVKPGMGKRLLEDFRKDPTLSRQRNTLVRNLTSMEQLKKVNQWEMDVNVRRYVVAIVILYFIVFLGLLGTFWFRVQQRVGEIAIRKVAGATSGDIFRRFLGEGMILVAIASLVSLVIDFCIYKYQLLEIRIDEKQWFIFLGIPALAAIILLGVSVIIGIWIPARRAMKIEPAVAIKTE